MRPAMLNLTSLYEEAISSFEFTCQLVKGLADCGDAAAGLDCAIDSNLTEHRFFSCYLEIDIQNETTYTCHSCNTTLASDVNITQCGVGFKLNLLTVVFETALKSIWFKLPTSLCDYNSSSLVQCYSDSVYYVNRTLHSHILEHFNYEKNLSVFESFQCSWNGSSDFIVPSGKTYDWIFLFVILFIVAGGVGNILVCLAVCLDKRLQNVTNYFLLSLAIADLLVSLFVMPMGAIPGFIGKSELCNCNNPRGKSSSSYSLGTTSTETTN